MKSLNIELESLDHKAGPFFVQQFIKSLVENKSDWWGHKELMGSELQKTGFCLILPRYWPPIGRWLAAPGCEAQCRAFGDVDEGQ